MALGWMMTLTMMIPIHAMAGTHPWDNDWSYKREVMVY
jgi:hypothetical protein